MVGSGIQINKGTSVIMDLQEKKEKEPIKYYYTSTHFPANKNWIITFSLFSDGTYEVVDDKSLDDGDFVCIHYPTDPFYGDTLGFELGYYKDGLLHKEDGPATMIYLFDKNLDIFKAERLSGAYFINYRNVPELPYFGLKHTTSVGSLFHYVVNRKINLCMVTSMKNTNGVLWITLLDHKVGKALYVADKANLTREYCLEEEKKHAKYLAIAAQIQKKLEEGIFTRNG